MHLRKLVQGSINAINRNKLIQWLASQGPINTRTTGVSVPTYAPVKDIWAQIQPLPTDELAHLDNLNIQGVLRQVYMYGAVATAVRADGTGGDLLLFPEIECGPLRQWLVVQVMEQWPDWCRVAALLQNGLNSAWTADSTTPADSNTDTASG